VYVPGSHQKGHPKRYENFAPFSPWDSQKQPANLSSLEEMPIKPMCKSVLIVILTSGMPFHLLKRTAAALTISK